MTSDAMKMAIEALRMSKDLLDVIEQTPGNVWHVAADDPETACCDTMSAVEKALAALEQAGEPVADAGGVTEDDVIGLINIVTDLAEVDALDKAYPVVWGRLDAMVNHAVAAATAAKDAEIARLREALLTINTIAAVQIGGSAQGNEAALKMIHDKTEAALSEAREAGAKD